VPKREAECFCGAKQSQAQQREVREAERTGARIPRDVAFLVVLLVLVGVYSLHRMTRPMEDTAAERPSESVSATPPTTLPSAVPVAAPVPSATATPPPSAPPPPALPPPTTLAALAVATPQPAPAATPTPVDEREQVRSAALRVLEAELARLSGLAQQLDEHLRVYKQECGAERKVANAIPNCLEIEATVKREASEIQRGLDTAEDQARQGWLNPGHVRDARSRSFFGSRRWDELQGAVSNPGR
jgi:hypothetical protein